MTVRASVAFWPLLLGLAAGCTLVAGRSGHQCDSDSDCKSYGAEFADSRCSLERVCVNVTVPQAAADGGSTACATNAECVAALAGPARCLQSTCVSLRSDDCTNVPGTDYGTLEDPVYVGVMAPFRDENVNYGANYVNAAFTAASVLNTNTLDVAKARSVVIVGCDETVDPVRAAGFLANTLKVSAIVGPMADTAHDAVLPVTKAAGIPLLSPLSDDPASAPNTDGLGWSCSPNRRDAVLPWNAAVGAVGDKALAAGGGTVLKVFLAASREPSVQSFATALEAALKFNDGKTISENGANYARGDYAFDPNKKPDLSAIVGQILLAKPTVVLIPSLFGGAALINAVEAGWTTSLGPRPHYLVHRIEPNISRDASSNQQTSRRGRIFGLEWARTATVSSNAAQFAGAFSSLNHTPAAFLAEATFDCTFSYVYGAYGSVGRQGGRLESLTGATFRSGVTLFSSPGEAKNVGGADARSISDTLLNTSNPVRVSGAATDLAYDVDLGAPHAASELFCIESAAGSWVSTGVVYDRTTGAGTGTFSCP